MNEPFAKGTILRAKNNFMTVIVIDPSHLLRMFTAHDGYEVDILEVNGITRSWLGTWELVYDPQEQA